ncbi:MAG: prepilin-type N-terminal cleavage/methylation domain-containing protein [Candidatus Thiodiazotropha sp. (ex Ustalcina ferruginea)]|nr:prepilin-type N-terminal cleavage/methylation domain-containing protein [Candidatus Thiodiazotropha sp. (ex Ustalcina ferruginea)]
MPGSTGFTLLELIVVLTIAGAGPPGNGSFTPRSEDQSG